MIRDEQNIKNLKKSSKFIFYFVFILSFCDVAFTKGSTDQDGPLGNLGPCAEDRFWCGNESEECIPIQWKCDGELDCDKGTDERDCNKRDKGKASCNDYQFYCEGICIARGWTCDGEIDCSDNSDEDPKLCSNITVIHPSKSCYYRGAHCFHETDTCVDFARICDGMPDCDDGSDEGLHCAEQLDNDFTGEALCPPLHCEYKCAILPNATAVCYCPDGQKPDLSHPNKCIDVHACSELFPCEQICTDIGGWNYTCTCHNGFVEQDGRCVADAQYFIVADSIAIKKISLSNGSVISSVDNTKHVHALAINQPANQLCWTEISTRLRSSALLCADLSNLDDRHKVEVPYDLDSVKHMLFDWLTGNLYFLDEIDGRVFVCNITRGVCVTLLKNKLRNPVGFAIDPMEGFIFLIAQGHIPMLSRCTLSGDNQTVLVSQKIVYPRIVTVDTYGKRVYFIDGFIDYIDSVDYDGNNRRTVFKTKLPVSEYLHGLTYFNGSLYSSTWHNSSAVSIPAWNRDHQPSATMNNIAHEIKHGIGIVIPAPTMQPNGANTCAGIQCDHMCIGARANTHGKCVCSAGYDLQPDGSCHAPTLLDRFLIYSKAYAGEISAIELMKPQSDKHPFVPIENLQLPKALDYYRDGGDIWIVFSDVTKMEISRRKLGSLQNEVILNERIHACEGLAFDWLTGNLYWTDKGYKTINIANITNIRGHAVDEDRVVLRKILYNSTANNLRAIVLHPTKGLMFWSYWDNAPKAGGIQSAFMNGENVTTLVNETLIQWPNGLTIDRENDILYWIDAYHDRIERINLDGTGRHCLYSGKSEYLLHPYGAAFYRYEDKEFLYWTELKSGKIYRLLLDSDSPKNITLMADLKPSLYSVSMYDINDRVAVPSHGCSGDPCSDLCLLTSTANHHEGCTCVCPEGRRFKTKQNKTCEDIPGYVPSSPCGTSKFECANGVCIDEKWTCDGEFDCLDASDESPEICKNNSCGDRRFRCALDDPPLCISVMWVCDGDNDCQSGEDEDLEMCKACPHGKFRCDNGGCIPMSWKCDLDDDCGDKSDEPDDCVHNTCSPDTEYTCLSGQCIPLKFKCDEENDCGDNSDEGEMARCKYACDLQNGFHCNSSRCIPDKWRCDGSKDCEDGEDEDDCDWSTPSTTPCSDDEFLCTSIATDELTCLPLIYKCDGDIDCKNHEDESDCGPLRNCTNQFTCLDASKCVLRMWVCDGDNDCDDGSDEVDCECEHPDTEVRCLTVEQENTCIPRCDGVVACVDGSDEDGCSYNGTCENGGCSFTCVDYSNNTFECTCPKGMKLDSDERSCSKIDYCAIRGHCSQRCVTLDRGYECACVDEWVLQPDRRTCSYHIQEPPPLLLYTTLHTIRSIPLSDTLFKEPEYHWLSSVALGGFEHVIAIDYHYKHGKLFFSDVVQDKISMTNLAYDEETKYMKLEKETESIVSDGLLTAECLAVDWLADNLYFVDSTLNQIEAIKLSAGQDFPRTVVVAGNLGKPRSLGLDPRDGLMFWTDWEVGNSRIERSTMAGEDRLVLWPRDRKRHLLDGWTNGLTIDYIERRIFWVDAKSDIIRSIKYDGSDEFTVIKDHLWLAHAFSLSMFGETLFWSDWSTTMLVAANKWNATNVPVVELVVSQPFDVNIYHQSRQPEGVNYCVDDPCGEVGICLLSNTSTAHYTCKCPYGHKLTDDGHTCVERDAIMFFSGNKHIRGLDPQSLNHSVTSLFPVERVMSPAAMDADATSIYWIQDLYERPVGLTYANGSDLHFITNHDTNDSSGFIMKADVVTGKVEKLVHEIFGLYERPTGMLIDRSARVMYISSYIDHHPFVNSDAQGFISVVTLDGRYQQRLISGLKRPCCLTADLKHKFLFYFDVGGIFTCGMDGKEQMNIINETNISVLKFDASDSTESPWKDVLYYVKNGNELYRANNNGEIDWEWKTTRIVLSIHGLNITALEVYNGTLYIANGTKIYTTPSSSPGELVLSSNVFTEIRNLLVYERNTKQSVSHCSTANGGCDEICLNILNGMKCLCTIGHKLINKTKCQVGTTPFLYYYGKGVSYRYLDGSSYWHKHSVPAEVKAMDYTDNHTFISLQLFDPQWQIVESNVNFTWSNILYERDMRDPRALEYDWVSKNIIIVFQDVIMVNPLYTKLFYVLYKIPLLYDRFIMDFALDPEECLMFFTEFHASKRKLFKLNYLGYKMEVATDKDVSINHFSVDIKTKRIYYVSSFGFVKSCDYDGNDAREIEVEASSCYAYNNTLYFTELQEPIGTSPRRTANYYMRKNLLSCDISAGCKDQTPLALYITLNDMKVFDIESRRQYSPNACSVDNGGCEHVCLPVNQTTRYCSCVNMVIDPHNETKCTAHEAMVYFSKDYGRMTGVVYNEKLNHTFLVEGNERVSTRETTWRRPTAAAFDFVNKKIFLAHSTEIAIKPFMTGEVITEDTALNGRLLNKGFGDVADLAYYRHENALYWAESESPKIRKLTLSNDSAVVVHKLAKWKRLKGLAIAECETSHYLFFTNSANKGPSIQRSEMDKSSTITDIVKSNIVSPHSITVDIMARHIYWSDGGFVSQRIERSDFDGKNRKVVFEYSSSTSKSDALVLLGDYLYWTYNGLISNEEEVILSINKLSGNKVAEIARDLGDFFLLSYYNDTCIANPCDVTNACPKPLMCVPNMFGQKRCLCPDGSAATDGTCADTMPISSKCSEQFEFYCGEAGLASHKKLTDRSCIPYNITCDGIEHCADGSDEAVIFCNTRSCRDGYFSCGNNRCILRSFVCNGIDECGDGTDEDICPCDKSRKQFKCKKSKKCIEQSDVCNGVLDCYDPNKDEFIDVSDESLNTTCIVKGMNHRCNRGFYRCNNTLMCIPVAFKCDGENDCGDNSDELKCDDQINHFSCPSNTFLCEDGSDCIPISWKCDYVDDCKDGSDEKCEKSCAENEFKCEESHRCIPESWQCDLEDDCSDKSDEKGCSNTACALGSVPCLNDPHHTCISTKWLCDNDEDCSDGSDEIDCAHNCSESDFKCERTGLCVHSAFVCDGDRDCKDGSDERNCNKIHQPCKSGQFQCATGACIPLVGRCDGFPACADLSDEVNCSLYQPTIPPAIQPICDPEDEIMCDNGKCIARNLTCDGTPDCKDFSDEAHVCNIAECDKKTLNNCQQKCIEMMYKYKCACYDGYKLQADGSSCEDIDECTQYDVYPPCSQKCTNKRGTFLCSCVEGFHVDPRNASKCIINKDAGEPFMIFANKFYLREMLLDGSKYRIRTKDMRNAVALDFHWKDKSLFTSDVTTDNSAIQRAQLFSNNITTTKSETIHKVPLSSIHGIAVDWIVGNLYWTDKGLDTIEVSKITGEFRKTLVKKDLDEPRAIVLHPLNGHLYWSDWGKEPYIGRIGMDGSDRIIVVHNTTLARNWPGKELGWPNALTIDYAADKLYWGDAKDDYIAYSDLDGSNINMLLQRTVGNTVAAHVFALTIFGDTLYWSDWHKKSIVSVHKYIGNSTVHEIKVDLVHRPMDLKVIHPTRQPTPDQPHPCTMQNGGCRDLCLISPGGNHVCECPDNFYLAEDGISCISNCTHSQFVCGNHKCIPFWWKCDEEDDCGDGTDEPDDCREFFCHAGLFQCHFSSSSEHQCISPTALCDGTAECKDGSDEINCEHHICMSTQFKCSESKPPRCIASIFRCDGTAQCDNNEDETGCPKIECQKDQIDCREVAKGLGLDGYNVSECIPRMWKCDGDRDCKGGVDETNCTNTSCKEDEYRCGTGQCISLSWTCDAENDCQDGSDESDEVCDSKQCKDLEFQCVNKVCIPERWKCDYDDDCGDNSDEEGCVPRVCTEDEFACVSNGDCIQLSYKCDDEIDCDDGSDEVCETSDQKPCQDGFFRCNGNKTLGPCLPESFKCDGYVDCHGGHDEQNCHSVIGSCDDDDDQMTKCLDGTCILKRWKCDGEVDCLDSSDEGPACNECPPGRLYKCKLNPVCITAGQICDGVIHCNGSKEDEMNCDNIRPSLTPVKAKEVLNATHCIMGLDSDLRTKYGFPCVNGQCISHEGLCDGVAECSDGTDELFCMESDCTKGSLCTFPHSHTAPLTYADLSQRCYSLPQGTTTGYYKSICSCREGFAHLTGLPMKQRKCMDVNECKISNVCSQTCINTHGSYKCECLEGYKKSGTSGCRLIESSSHPPASLIVASGIPPVFRNFSGLHEEVKKTPLEHHMGIKGTDITSMDIVIDTGAIVWTDKCKIYLWEQNQKDPTNKEMLNLCPKSSPTSVIVDNFGGNLFWLDKKLKRVYVAAIKNMNERKVVLTEKSWSNPMDIAIDFSNGYLYVAHWSSESSIKAYIIGDEVHLHRARSKRTFLRLPPTEIKDVQWPMSIAVDPITNYLYWVDAKKRTVEMKDPHSKLQSVVHHFTDDVPYKLKIFSDYIFVSMYRTSKIIRIPKVSGRDQTRQEHFVVQEFDTMPVFAVTMPTSYEIYRSQKTQADHICRTCKKFELCINAHMISNVELYSCMGVCHCSANQTCSWSEDKQQSICIESTPVSQATSPTIAILAGIVAALIVVMAIVVFRRRILQRCCHPHSRGDSPATNPLYVALQADQVPSPEYLYEEPSEETIATTAEGSTESIDKVNFHNPLYDRVFNSQNMERTQLLDHDQLDGHLSDHEDENGEGVTT